MDSCCIYEQKKVIRNFNIEIKAFFLKKNPIVHLNTFLDFATLHLLRGHYSSAVTWRKALLNIKSKITRSFNMVLLGRINNFNQYIINIC